MRYFLTLFIILSISACSGLSDRQEVQVRKSPSDTREYRYLQLDNGLKIMLVSDPSTDFSAASLDVYAGSGSDPLHRQGLAHFLEHMLFLGTEKYPDSDDYLRFLKDNGGNHNAYTSFEHTNYFFDIRPDRFEPALDRFSQFFVAPLLTEKYVEREKHAVHSEYKASIKDEFRRQLDALRQVISDEHPLDKFSVGNLDTLSSSESPIRNDLLEFYRKYYVAGNMALSVLGRESLDELELMVRGRFAAVPRGSVPERVISQPLLEPQVFGKTLFIKPEKNIRQLSLLFPLPDQAPYYRSKPLDVVAYVLGHEGEGSLLSFLKQKNWVESLSASQALAYNGGTLFMVNVDLTESGLRQHEAVVIALFQAIQRLRQEGIPHYLVEEIKKVSRLEFDFREKEKPMSYVMGIANNLHYYAPAEVLTAERLVEAYDESLTRSILARLVPDNVLLVVVGDQFKPQGETALYQVPYALQANSSALRNELAAIKTNEEIRLPVENMLLPDDLAITPPVAGRDKPLMIVRKPGVQLWHKPVQEFVVPRATSYFSFRKKDVRATARSSVLLDFYMALLNDDFNEWLYPARMAGLSLQLYGHVRGVNLKIEGFSDKQGELLSQALQHVRQAEFDDIQFARIRAMLLRDWENAAKRPPVAKLMSEWAETMQKPSWSNAEKIQILQTLHPDDVRMIAGTFWQGMDVMAMTNGNISEAEAKAMLADVEKFVTVKPGSSDITVARLDANNRQLMVASEHPDNAYMLYWQAPDADVKTQAGFMLLSSALESGFFNELRTEQQLGYVVYNTYAPLVSVPGMLFVVQSPVASVAQIHSAVSGFLAHARSDMLAMPASNLQQLQQALLQELLQQPLSLLEESEAYWYDLVMGYHNFDRKQQLASAIEAVTLEEWQAFIRRQFELPWSRMLLLSTPADVEVDGFGGYGQGNSISQDVYRFGDE